ncbi:MAG: T9SS type A sorting domain-containing protein, partial [Bacteroidota bacterium]
AKSNIQGGTSPWVYLSDTYPNGERLLLQSNATHVFKFIDDGNNILTVDSLRIVFDPITSFGWNFLLGKDKIWYTYDPKYNPDNNQFTRLFKLGDASPNDPFSDIITLDTLNFGDLGINRVQHFAMAYDGNILFHSESDEDSMWATIGVIDPNFNLLDTLRYATNPGEIVHHNAFPVDENNGCYVVTTNRLIKFQWDGNAISKDWEAAYDFVNDGPTGSFAEGSGTTPTLMGWGAGNDQLIVMADGHERNNLVAFWRELPAGWSGVPGMDIRFADSIRIPLAVASNNTFQSIENSPTVFGYEVAIAQFNGFLGYDCDNVKGVQKVSWDQTTDQFSVAWANDSVNMNGVLTYSLGSDLVYGSGKEDDCIYYYYGLDWQSGEIALRIPLGPEGTFLDDPFYDGGSNNIIDEDGNIYFPGGNSLVKVEVVQRATNLEEDQSAAIRVFPNPASDHIRIEGLRPGRHLFRLYSLSGKLLIEQELIDHRISLQQLPSGIYFLQLEGEDFMYNQKIIRP